MEYYFELWKSRERERVNRGIPIGNLTSQLFANIYLDVLDKFIKHNLKISAKGGCASGAKYYLCYCDDFVVLGSDLEKLKSLIEVIEHFLNNKLKLKVHPNKIIIRKLKQGIDFLSYVVLPHYRLLRTKTKRRMFKRANRKNLSSYLGLLQHCNSYKLSRSLASQIYKEYV
ncbi:MAG: hypothetical protein COX39_02930 [Candidatus Nealsonbacteria bacterium CG23_combo_of_CG06-09_8_20_14_all_40_13]|uniref:Reverse transcriptase domain-containing protein n=1 Tax=Candidatus Nealsonbacteria bacterium CG23_combo_of_CG06-09_8_20_14_all_40_13 TaxID=1974724 RepID=A0A2G9YQC2_9BACT|nr:MAG: hypothetical protein COX39_02930 [Candidatus Nealsonbacteria bacterium CG23_combo_of_CG06-09_8_20_14_all_40_13]PIR71261.1 MAG: hypothetical protein COU44_00390 [Candidatus Nealsonbacteria bacterium CG10_big_fil_rev_8_21_14_0_10_40_24]